MTSDNFPHQPHQPPADEGISLSKEAQPPEWTTSATSPYQQGPGASPYVQADLGGQTTGSAYPAYPQAQYGQQYAQPQYGYGQPPAHQAYASWLQRVGAYLLDSLLQLPGTIVQITGIVLFCVGAASGPARYDAYGQITHEGNNAMMIIGGLLFPVGLALALAIHVWNRWIKGGQGASWGKRQMGLRLVNEQTGQPIGTGGAFVRDLAHFLDGLALNIGYLWPLWDPKRQTFADKVCSTVVVRESSVQQHPQGYGY